jgi:predicted Zn-dependent protease
LTPRGDDLPQTTHGRYSKHIPTRIVKDYEGVVDDPDRLNVDHEIGLVTARLMDVLKRVDSGESGRLWATLRATYDEAQEAQRMGEQDRARALLRDVGVLIKQGQGDWAAWDEAMRLADRRVKYVEAETRRQDKMRQYVTEDQARLFYRALIMAVREHVPDNGTRTAIMDTIAQITGEREPRPAGVNGA